MARESDGKGEASKADLLARLGYGGDPSAYDGALHAAGLSNPRKSRISMSKQGAVAETLGLFFFRVCNRGDCRARADELSGERRVVPASGQPFCEVCGGSANRAAVERMIAAMRGAGLERLCVVGGSPDTHADLGSAVGGRIQLRLIDGETSRTRAAADADLAWADLVVIWGGTILAHKVSTLYKGEKVITVAKRSVSELSELVAERAGRTARTRGG